MVYGTSIAQGACSSRPGMSWINIVRRNLSDYPVVNLGFSGNGRLEPEVLALIAEIDAEMFVLDCMPNLTQKSADEARDLVLCRRGTAPQEQRRPDNTRGARRLQQRPDQRRAARLLHAPQPRTASGLRAAEGPGVKDLHYVSHDELAYPSRCMGRLCAPSDLGAQRQADVLTEKIRSVRNH